MTSMNSTLSMFLLLVLSSFPTLFLPSSPAPSSSVLTALPSGSHSPNSTSVSSRTQVVSILRMIPGAQRGTLPFFRMSRVVRRTEGLWGRKEREITSEERMWVP